jgi:hypothetical protein
LSSLSLVQSVARAGRFVGQRTANFSVTDVTLLCGALHANIGSYLRSVSSGDAGCGYRKNGFNGVIWLSRRKKDDDGRM